MQYCKSFIEVEGTALIPVSVCVCVCPCGAVVCAVNFRAKHCGFDPRQVQSHMSFFSFFISGWLPTAKCVCLSMEFSLAKIRTLCSYVM